MGKLEIIKQLKREMDEIELNEVKGTYDIFVTETAMLIEIKKIKIQEILTLRKNERMRKKYIKVMDKCRNVCESSIEKLERINELEEDWVSDVESDCALWNWESSQYEEDEDSEEAILEHNLDCWDRD